MSEDNIRAYTRKLLEEYDRPSDTPLDTAESIAAALDRVFDGMLQDESNPNLFDDVSTIIEEGILFTLKKYNQS